MTVRMKLFRDFNLLAAPLVMEQLVSGVCRLSCAFHAAGNSPPDVRRSDTGQYVYAVDDMILCDGNYGLGAYDMDLVHNWEP